MLKISKNKSVFAMSTGNEPAARCGSGDTVIFETKDCFGEQIQSESQTMGTIDWGNINPATGPLFVNGAKAGDVLKVEILDIALAPNATVCDAPDEGVIGKVLTDSVTKIYPVSDGMLAFSDSLNIPIKPMIGVIGTAPAGEEIPTGTPGDHGGNMDCTQIGAGSVLYLPVNVEGALLAMGDLHAVMGDGEVVVCGAEISGEVTVKVTVLENCAYPTPFLVTDRAFAAIASADSLDAAAEKATLNMHSFLQSEMGMTDHDAGMLLSLVGDVRVCQMVDPQKTCRMEVPMYVAESFGKVFA